MRDQYTCWTADDFFGIGDDFQEDMDMQQDEERQKERAVSIYRAAIEVHDDEIINDIYMVLALALADRKKILEHCGIEVTEAFLKETDHEFRTLFKLALNRCMGE